jgi:hypothetical protein
MGRHLNKNSLNGWTFRYNNVLGFDAQVQKCSRSRNTENQPRKRNKKLRKKQRHRQTDDVQHANSQISMETIQQNLQKQKSLIFSSKNNEIYCSLCELIICFEIVFSEFV